MEVSKNRTKHRPNVSSRLTDNINSDYLEAVSSLYNKNIILVYVEGYDDISFWRGLLSEFETEGRRFEISPPVRNDLAKGKKIVLNFLPKAGPHLLLCVDSDFDYLFGDYTAQSRMVNNGPFVIQTYTYSIENYLCYPPSLHAIASRATKNDMQIFDFVQFIGEYSRIIHPLFVWYVFAAKIDRPSVFPLADFRNAVRINYLNIENNGEATLEWLKRQVDKKLHQLELKYPKWKYLVSNLDSELKAKGVTEEETHLYMQGHTLMDNVVMTLLENVCEELRKLSVAKIMSSTREGLSLNNELSYYNNKLDDVDALLMGNMLYKRCPLYKNLNDSLLRALI